MFGLKIYKIAGHSMEPGLKPGQYVLARQTNNIKLEDIVICTYDNQNLIKRVKSIAPEGISVRGDNQNSSLDSRDIGLISQDKVLGKVLWF
jgi:phage repressor protein C with HTH and peptisase S24 domain